MANLVIDNEKKTNKKFEGGYQEKQLIFITYSPPISDYHIKTTGFYDDVDDEEDIIDEELDTDDEEEIDHYAIQNKKHLQRIYKLLLMPFSNRLRKNHYIYQVESGKGGNFHVHVILLIKDRLEFDLFMGHMRNKTKLHGFDFRRVTELKGAFEYIEKDTYYKNGKYPYINNSIDEIKELLSKE